MSTAIRVLVIESRPIVRSAIVTLLSAIGFQVAAEVGNCQDAAAVYDASNPNAVLVCLGPDSATTIESVAELEDKFPGVNIVTLLLANDGDAISSALQNGVRGIVGGFDSVIGLTNAVNTVANGGSYYSVVPQRLATAFGTATRKSKLAPRELRILRMIAEGKSNKEIAVTLGLEVETVRNYRKSIMRKLNAHNVATLLKAAASEGLISLAGATGTVELAATDISGAQVSASAADGRDASQADQDPASRGT